MEGKLSGCAGHVRAKPRCPHALDPHLHVGRVARNQLLIVHRHADLVFHTRRTPDLVILDRILPAEAHLNNGGYEGSESEMIDEGKQGSSSEGKELCLRPFPQVSGPGTRHRAAVLHALLFSHLEHYVVELLMLEHHQQVVLHHLAGGNENCRFLAGCLENRARHKLTIRQML